MADKQISKQLELFKRGAVDVLSEVQLKEKLEKAAAGGKQLRIKVGLDPTSPDIHLGHTVVLRKMRQFQDAGHKAVLIIGDYTTKIGDPTGRNATRPVLSDSQIKSNAETYFAQAGKILDTSEDKLEVRHNSQWLSDLKLEDIIKLTSVMTVARMLERDTFEKRYKKGQPIGLHEFLYPLMQGYDSVMIDADVELGGTDQTFNNLVGRDMQKLFGKDQQVVMTMPILVGLDGTEKMSKSKDNYIGVTDEPNEMFGKIMSIPDELMENYFTLLTDVEAEKIAVLTDASKTHPKEAKVTLGKMIVTEFYDEKLADAAAENFDQVFAKNQMPDNIDIVEISPDEIMLSKLLLSCKLVASGADGKRMVKQGAVSIDGEKMANPSEMITVSSGMVLQVGKRKFAKLRMK